MTIHNAPQGSGEVQRPGNLADQNVPTIKKDHPAVAKKTMRVSQPNFPAQAGGEVAETEPIGGRASRSGSLSPAPAELAQAVGVVSDFLSTSKFDPEDLETTNPEVVQNFKKNLPEAFLMALDKLMPMLSAQGITVTNQSGALEILIAKGDQFIAERGEEQGAPTKQELADHSHLQVSGLADAGYLQKTDNKGNSVPLSKGDIDKVTELFSESLLDAFESMGIILQEKSPEVKEKQERIGPTLLHLKFLLNTLEQKPEHSQDAKAVSKFINETIPTAFARIASNTLDEKQLKEEKEKLAEQQYWIIKNLTLKKEILLQELKTTEKTTTEAQRQHKFADLLVVESMIIEIDSLSQKVSEAGVVKGTPNVRAA